MADELGTPPTADVGEVDAKDFLRALLRISPEDAEKAREAATTKAAGGQRGPERDYGDQRHE